MTGIAIKRVYEIVQSRASGGERVGPLHDNELIQSVKYPFDRRTVYWLTEKGVKAKRARREVIHIEDEDRTTHYEPQIPAVNAGLVDAIPGYSGLFRAYSRLQSGHSEGSTGVNLEISEAHNVVTISFRKKGNADKKSFSEGEGPTKSSAEKLLDSTFPDSRTHSGFDPPASPDNGEKPKKPTDRPDSKPESAGKRQDELDSETVRETILTWPFMHGQKVSRTYVVAVIAASIRRRYPQWAARDIELKIKRLAIEDPEIRTLLAERTEDRRCNTPLLTLTVKTGSRYVLAIATLETATGKSRAICPIFYKKIQRTALR